jgi:hypothetical protein
MLFLASKVVLTAPAADAVGASFSTLGSTLASTLVRSDAVFAPRLEVEAVGDRSSVSGAVSCGIFEFEGRGSAVARTVAVKIRPFSTLYR